MTRSLAVFLLLFDAVLYAFAIGWKPAAGWLAAAIATAQFFPRGET